ncbi:hypothetical protein SVIO_007890 [Streptomyces violaceusniger]|uniref:Peptidase M20 dimerisation domain-containing protein n=1 Tax=Streptomyces violaceusniger TaxID=68280 RepID=A0A4D4KTE8_STRVO|nr:hypothetical protein SVIO_007890 [Streptomyces violaceusniger]
MTEINERVTREFQKNLDSVTELSHEISAHPELAFEEHDTSARVIAALEGSGAFEVERGVADLPTAFVATAGSGDFVFGICAEMDALPDIGHGCGHNAIAASSVGAALALAPFVDELGITLRVFGTPAEEKGTGKEVMLRRGVFQGTHAAMMVHPSLKNVVDPKFRASRSWRITYTGRGGHASRPWDTLNAADSTVVAQTAIGLLRQQLRDGILVHHVVKDPGGAVNVIPATTVMECMIRADTIEEVDEVWERVKRCFEAGALAAGTSAEIELLPSLYREFHHDQVLAPSSSPTRKPSAGRSRSTRTSCSARRTWATCRWKSPHCTPCSRSTFRRGSAPTPPTSPSPPAARRATSSCTTVDWRSPSPWPTSRSPSRSG